MDSVSTQVAVQFLILPAIATGKVYTLLPKLPISKANIGKNLGFYKSFVRNLRLVTKAQAAGSPIDNNSDAQR